MKKPIYALLLTLLIVTGLVFSNRAINKESSVKSKPRPLSAAEMNAEKKKWEASPAGVAFKKWEASPAGTKVLAASAKIQTQVSASSNMEAVITSLTLPAGSRVGFGMMIQIDGEDYILSFGPKKTNEFQQLLSLKVNDKIKIRNHFVSYAPKYLYPIIAGEYIERDKKLIYKRIPVKGGC